MKTQLFSFLTILFCAFSAQSQTVPPPYINYQAVLYDVNSQTPNVPLVNQSFPTFVNIQDELGNLLYKEEHYASTDANGLITVKMGDGVYMAGPITNFNSINWGVGKYYLIVDFDINGTISSTAPEQLVTVPYSFYSGKAGNGMSAVNDNGDGTLTFTYANGATYTTPTLSGIQGPIGPAGPQGTSGPAGQSAYDLWLAQGNTGTVQDYLTSSAYEIWLSQGNTGTQQTFLNSLIGPQGPQGVAGNQGIAGVSISSTNNNGNGTYTFNYSDGTSFTTSDLTIPASSNSGMPTGSIIAYVGITAPNGWMICNGTELNRTSNSNLFNVIGISYGDGDGSTTFNVPDLRGMFLRGSNNNSGNDPNASTRTSFNGGNSGDNLGSYQTDELKSHNHGLTGRSAVGGGGNFPSVTSGGATNINIPHIGGAGGLETRPKNISVNYIIKL